MGDAFLQDHGTKLVDLPPGAIAGAAQHDLQMRERKKPTRDGLGRVIEHPTVSRTAHYAFHRSHVRFATDAADLLARALADRETGLGSGKVATRLIYRDEDKLRAAAELARSQGTATQP